MSTYIHGYIYKNIHTSLSLALVFSDANYLSAFLVLLYLHHQLIQALYHGLLDCLNPLSLQATSPSSTFCLSQTVLSFQCRSLVFSLYAQSRRVVASGLSIVEKVGCLYTTEHPHRICGQSRILREVSAMPTF